MLDELIQCNISSLFSVTSKVYENWHVCTSQNATIMGVLVHRKKNIDSLELECNMPWNMVINLSKDALSTSSNHRMSINSVRAEFMEEDAAHQLKDEMDIEQ
jgi:hypothetical protein